MKKAEMQQATQAYNERLIEARSLIRRGRLADGVRAAVTAWQYLDGMMRYQSRYEQVEFDSVHCIDLVCEYAPIVLDFDSLEQLDALLSSQRRIEKNTDESLAAKLSDARARLRHCWRLLDELEHHGPIAEDAINTDFGSLDERNRLIDKLVRHGLVLRVARELRLATRMHEEWVAKCNSCGVRCRAAKRRFLVYSSCPSCGQHESMTLKTAADRLGGSQ